VQPSHDFDCVGSLSLWGSGNFDIARATLSVLLSVGSLSLRRGANFDMPRAAFLALCVVVVLHVENKSDKLYNHFHEGLGIAAVWIPESLADIEHGDEPPHVSGRFLLRMMVLRMIHSKHGHGHC